MTPFLARPVRAVWAGCATRGGGAGPRRRRGSTPAITRADLDRCRKRTKGGGDGGTECVITNVARAHGRDPEGHRIVSEPARAGITVNETPGKPCAYGCDDGCAKRRAGR